MNELSFFQFDNLVKNRVPFCLLNFAEPVAGLYKGLFKMHLENIEATCSPTDYKQVIDEKRLPKDFPIVLLCQKGTTSAQIQEELQKQGFGNVFAFQGGIEEMRRQSLV